MVQAMETHGQPSPVFPVRISSRAGLSMRINANGSIRRIDHGDIMINLLPGNEIEGGPAMIHLRRLGAAVESVPLLGPGSPACYEMEERGLRASGAWNGLLFRVRLVLAENAPAWFWHVEVENTGQVPVNCDLILTQDLALAHEGAVRLNEYYVSQYVDHTPLVHARHGTAVASRQNQSMGGRCPWLVTGSLGRAVSYGTDALQFHGRATRAGQRPVGLVSGLPGKRLQQEHSMVSLQEEAFLLEPGASIRRGFFSWFEADRKSATAPADVSFIDSALALPEAAPQPLPSAAGGFGPLTSLFTQAPLLNARDLDETEVTRIFGADCRHAERQDGRLLSLFTGGRNHVVLKAKELMVLRPHGHLLRTGAAWTPDESALTSTAWMAGVFHSMVTQGHVSINRFLSTCHTYLGLFRSHGQRVFAEIDGAWRLLDVPSAFMMAPDSCRWIYQHAGGRIEVASTAGGNPHELGLSISVTAGPPLRFLIAHHVAINGDDGSAAIPVVWERDEGGVFVRAVPDCDVGRRFPQGGFRIMPAGGTRFEMTGGDELLFADGVSRGQPFLCMVTEPALSAGLLIAGRLVESGAMPAEDFSNSIAPDLRIDAPEAGKQAAAAGRVAEIFPWFIHNALVHCLSPRGLEQYSGGGWGTRDVCQGPVELFLALGHHAPLRDVLCRVFRQQNPDGDWPQWFMFFERERNIRPGDSHGDIVHWPVLALAQYLTATGDAALLDETLPFFHPDGAAAAETATLWQHVERALDVILDRVIHGTSLAAYGHGDWNDSLQPVRADMRERLCSSWTVTLNYQTFIALAGALRRLGNTGRAIEFETMASNILGDFQRLLVVDDVVAGFAYFREDGKTDYLLHPRDGATGLSYSLLPMIHAIINDMFTPRQAEAHLALIREHLTGPDGAHLFDRPMAYHGGPQTYFQRAESASYFGREIGIMYTHAHLRYCEALARFGDVEGFFRALCQANPIAIRGIVPSAAPRQANCYHSSSDPAFADRYEAHAHYDKVNRGEVALEGGWRVYSSGAGIAARLIVQCFLGLRFEKDFLIVDPVMPAALDGLKARLSFAGRPVEVLYRIARRGCGTASVNLNGADLDFIREQNPYRCGAARIAMESIMAELTGSGDRLTVWLD
jgi:cellobiose phosphorylase